MFCGFIRAENNVIISYLWDRLLIETIAAMAMENMKMCDNIYGILNIINKNWSFPLMVKSSSKCSKRSNMKIVIRNMDTVMASTVINSFKKS